ncbi:GPN-loop GTPase 2 isoform X2 [Bombus pyrosoma]|uniref:GPN-loop GTPase 2 isoform X2 n=1 Tax=Bombus pyrosoma TaxID=396416 RepID=UPI001CB92DBC|nr:GPN-loop GTPase 2 isoform X2 [Bombus pyrosoma]
MSLIFGQLVIGPPGSGKTTYCYAMTKFLEKLGRKVAVINIDPANENMQYTPTVDISELIKHEEVMSHYGLGPNGALVYCMEFLEANIKWLITKVLNLKDHYLIFDCPGQVELYTHHNSVSAIAEKLGQNLVRLCSVHLVDSHHCSDAEVLDLNYLLDKLDEGPFTSKYKKLNAAFVSLIEDYSLVSFIPLDISNQTLLLQVKNAVDKANGYIFGGNEPQDVQTLLACAVGAMSETEKMSTIDAYF